MSSPEIVCLDKKPQTEASAWSFTATKDTEFSFAWTIENFSRKMESYDNGKELYSGVFKVIVEGLETSWKLRCYPNGQKEDDRGNVSMFLQCNDNSHLKTFKRQLIYSFELVNQGGSRTFKMKAEQCCTTWVYKDFDSWGWKKFVSHEKLKSEKNKLLPKDCIEVFCVMKFDGPEVTTSGASPPPTNFALEQKEEGSLVDLLETGLLADVELMCEGKTFSCHKAILARKSPVFMANICNNMKEKATGQINIEGIDQDTVNDMLTHVYGGKIEKLEDKADELLVAADRYDLKQLKWSCEEMLSRSLKIDNCLKRLILADRHSCDTLKPVVIKFIVENFLKVVSLDNWMESLNNYSDLFKEVFEELATLRSSDSGLYSD